MKKTCVSNSTPLIYLSKIGEIRLLKSIFEKVYIPKAVFEEVVVRGGELNKIGVIPLEKMIKEGFIEVKEVQEQTKIIPTLHRGEMDAISLARNMEIGVLLIDDKEGYTAAGLFRLQPLRTTALLLMLYRDGAATYEAFCDSLLRLSEEGYFMKAEVYNRLIKKAKELKDSR